MKKLIFLGTNGVFERHLDAADRQEQEVAGVIDSDWYGNRDTFAGVPVLDTQTCFDTDPDKYRDYVFFVGTNWFPIAGRDIEKRKMFIDIVRRHNLELINLIDPTAYIGRGCELGRGIFIGDGSHIEPRTKIHDFATFWGYNGIAHDSNIGENTVFQRGAGIFGKIGHDCFVGQYTNIYDNVPHTVGDNVIINSFLHVARDVKDNENVVLDRNNLKVYRNANAAL